MTGRPGTGWALPAGRRPSGAAAPRRSRCRFPTAALIDRGDPRPAAPAAVDELHPALVAATRRGGPGLAGPDLEHAVAAAAPLVAEAGPDDPAAAAAGIGATVAAMQRLTVPPSADRPVDWSRFGVVIPILAGSAGAGASVLAATLADALGQAGRRVLLVDAADPARSGLAAGLPGRGRGGP